MPIAAQVYSVREEAGADFAGTMKQLKALGYDGVELAGLYGRTSDEIKGWLEEAGLTPIGAMCLLMNLIRIWRIQSGRITASAAVTWPFPAFQRIAGTAAADMKNFWQRFR